MNDSSTSPQRDSHQNDPNTKSTSMGFLSLILLSAGILLLGWGLMTVLNMVLG